MAAAEARAAWQRAANRCLVQEDRKRAPKLACCPSSSEQQHGTSSGNCVTSEGRPISNFMHLSWSPMNSNLPPDIRWWLQLQPNFGVQKDLVSEAHEKIVEDLAPKPKHEEPLLCETIGTNVEKSEDVFEPPWMVSASFMKYSSETGLEELRTIGGYSQVPLKSRGTLYEDKELLDFKSSDSPPLKNQQKANFDMDAPWKEVEKIRPWWQITDENELASLVAERAVQHIENCDLPRPTQTVRVHHGTESHSQENICHSEGPSSPAGRVSHPVPGQCEHINLSYSSESTDLSLSNNRVWQQHERNYTYSGAQDFPNSSNTGSESKQTLQNVSERDRILEALCHSQTRAREAEMAAKKAHNEKDDVINLLLRQASDLFACNQCLKIFQLENMGLQLKHKEHQITTVIPELPWMTLKEKPTLGQEQKVWTRRKGRRQKKGGGFFDAILFAVGLGLAGAGFLLGWTLGWLLPRL
ncbi:uncharacterized protein LOC133896187 [Phragmites australis]|uniref:uncharacterized protein LOC133896187 n=1 Tax=Phragmites australis TaxID=29695 RepID=UPI002D77C7A4|nr:uncharacterized protein LOC133896187 [Phragmites australis]